MFAHPLTQRQAGKCQLTLSPPQMNRRRPRLLSGANFIYGETRAQDCGIAIRIRNTNLSRRKLTEGKEERRPSPVASISRSVSSVPFSLDLADVNNRTRIVAKNRRQLYQGNPVNMLRIYCKLGENQGACRIHHKTLPIIRQLRFFPSFTAS